MIGIYCIENKINKKKYVGQSNNIERRFKEHCYSNNQVIDKAITKEGVSNFNFYILEECSITALNEKEDFWIKKENCIIPNGYNIGYCHSTSIGEKNSQSKLTNEDVIFLRVVYDKKEYHSCREIWNKYYKNKITYASFTMVFNGKKWSHIKPEVFTKENNDYYKDTSRTNWMENQNGEKNLNSVCLEEDVIKIRKMYVKKERKEIFKIFPQYSQRLITSIISGQNWKNLPIYKKREKKWIYPSNYTEKEINEWNKN